MPVKFTSKDGVADRMGAAEVNVPIVQIKPTGFKETGPGIQTHAIGNAEPSLNVPTERMGAAKPWISKAGHAVAAANAHDPASSKPSMRVQKKKAQGPTNGYAGQSDGGGYVDAGAAGGYT